ncbi:MAG: thymidine phosphorylase, partial [Firmicutes bacterium HGW-Firmicutes-13]
KNVKDINLAVISQTANLVPSDKKLYALRDVTATVDSIPLIASSIMSKKYASGAKALMLDVKTGKGAFMKTRGEAVNLSRAMVNTGNMLGLKTGALITDMNQPLGRTVGNSLEVKEAIMTLKGQGPEDLTELCLTLGSYMLVLGGKTRSPIEGKEKIKEVLYSGMGLEKFKIFIEAQGGNSDIINNFEKLPQASYVERYNSPSEGFIKEIDAFKIGIAAMTLGAGREKKEDSIDLAVGIELKKKVGDWVNKGEPLFIIYSSHPSKTVQAVKILSGSFILDKERPEVRPLIYDIIFPE